MREGAGIRRGGQTEVAAPVASGGRSRASMNEVYRPAGAEQSIKISRANGGIGEL